MGNVVIFFYSKNKNYCCVFAFLIYIYVQFFGFIKLIICNLLYAYKASLPQLHLCISLSLHFQLPCLAHNNIVKLNTRRGQIHNFPIFFSFSFSLPFASPLADANFLRKKKKNKTRTTLQTSFFTFYFFFRGLLHFCARFFHSSFQHFHFQFSRDLLTFVLLWRQHKKAF